MGLVQGARKAVLRGEWGGQGWEVIAPPLRWHQADIAISDQ